VGLIGKLRVAGPQYAVGAKVDAELLLQRRGDVDLGEHAEAFFLQLIRYAGDGLFE